MNNKTVVLKTCQASVVLNRSNNHLQNCGFVHLFLQCSFTIWLLCMSYNVLCLVNFQIYIWWYIQIFPCVVHVCILPQRKHLHYWGMEIRGREWKLFTLQAARKLIFASFCTDIAWPWLWYEYWRKISFFEESCYNNSFWSCGRNTLL